MFMRKWDEGGGGVTVAAAVLQWSAVRRNEVVVMVMTAM